MIRPKNWYDLPHSLQVALAENVELEYDRYEGSHVEAMNDVLNNPTFWIDNSQRIQRYYESRSESDLQGHIQNLIQSAQYQIQALTQFLNS